MATGIVIAATHSGAGKTTVTLGILRALSKRIEVEPFKVGPDYIDPAFHQYACRKPSHNLDYYLLGEEKLRQLFFEKASPSGLSVVEGVMGLYDGINATSDGSTAQVAKILHLPVLLVVEAGSLGASVSAMVLGYVHYDPHVHIAGVIFNRVGNARHYELLKCCVERDVGIPVVGYLPVDLSIQFPERHLGLVPSGETEQLEERLERLSSQVERTVDLDAILQIAQQAGRITSVSSTPSFIPLPTDLTIAIASDNAFNFYYPDGLEVFQRCGARLLSFSPLHDTALPPGTDGLILGGGFPEVFARELSEKVTMKHSLRRAIQDGLPTYAECGGLMYLTEEIIDSKGESFPMVGVFPVRTRMGHQLDHFGYVEVQVTHDNVLSQEGAVFRGHEFHYSTLEGSLLPTCYRVQKPGRNESWESGWCYQNCLASYVHLHFYAYPELVIRFLECCRKNKPDEGKKKGRKR